MLVAIIIYGIALHCLLAYVVVLNLRINLLEKEVNKCSRN